MANAAAYGTAERVRTCILAAAAGTMLDANKGSD